MSLGETKAAVKHNAFPNGLTSAFRPARDVGALVSGVFLRFFSMCVHALRFCRSKVIDRVDFTSTVGSLQCGTWEFLLSVPHPQGFASIPRALWK